jgi:hypothetical protein
LIQACQASQAKVLKELLFLEHRHTFLSTHSHT